MHSETPTYRRDRARLPAAERRLQIIEVATELIADRGFWGLSIQDVADRCGLTVPGVLHHVSSKDGLLIAVLEHRDAEDTRMLAAALANDDELILESVGPVHNPVPRLRRVCSAVVRHAATQPEIVRLFAVLEAESLAPNHPAHDYFQERQAKVLSVFAEMAAGLTDHPETLARQVMALMDGLQMQWLRTPDSIDLVNEWETVSEVLFSSRLPQ
ncbi:TetR/AcrR family transcriptional regulator [Mycolicibacter heraklionensis]|nr:TetR/AcrR family transcriptional regulator [Mycolicibacter heraklionensis]